MKVLILEDNKERQDWFSKNLKCSYTMTYSSEKAIDLLKENVYDYIFLDHDLGGEVYVESGPGTGYEVAKFLEDHPENKNNTAIIVTHSWNSIGAKAIVDCFPNKEEIFYAPFGRAMFLDVIERIGK